MVNSTSVLRQNSFDLNNKILRNVERLMWSCINDEIYWKISQQILKNSELTLSRTSTVSQCASFPYNCKIET